MPRYFFHTEDHVLIYDQEGCDCADDQAARAEAVRRFASTIASRPEDVWDGARWRMIIADETGRVLWSLELHADKGASVVPWARRAS